MLNFQFNIKTNVKVYRIDLAGSVLSLLLWRDHEIKRMFLLLAHMVYL
jgi:hypothetical protein